MKIIFVYILTPPSVLYIIKSMETIAANAHDVDFIVNKTKGAFVKLNNLYTPDVIDDIHNFLCEKGIWNETDCVIRTQRLNSYIPDRRLYADVSFSVKFFNEKYVAEACPVQEAIVIPPGLPAVVTDALPKVGDALPKVGDAAPPVAADVPIADIGSEYFNICLLPYTIAYCEGPYDPEEYFMLKTFKEVTVKEGFEVMFAGNKYRVVHAFYEDSASLPAINSPDLKITLEEGDSVLLKNGLSVVVADDVEVTIDNGCIELPAGTKLQQVSPPARLVLDDVCNVIVVRADHHQQCY